MMAIQKKVLVVDDDVFLSKILSSSIVSKGFQVENAYSGQEALDKIKKGHFDLILLDLMLPDKNGFEVLEKMKARKDKTPVVVLSNLAQKKDIDEAMAFGPKRYFVKIDTSIDEISEFADQLLNH
jgi:CheY-like chemotaxis protein